MSDDLLERGTRAMMQSEPWSSFWGRADAEKLARAAIAVALEEAARVAEQSPIADYDVHFVSARKIAAAIRAMITKESA